MPPRLLIVEDEDALLELLGYNFERAGYAVDTARSGNEVRACLADGAPDLIILDWTLPGVSGIEICRRLRRDPMTARIPIIMLTARGDEADRARGLATGADDYVVKPFSIAGLLARAAELLRQARPQPAATRADIDAETVG